MASLSELYFGIWNWILALLYLKNKTAEFLRNAGCKDVQVELPLLNRPTERLPSGTNTTNGARLDVSAIGVWTPLDRAFVDIRVLNPQAKSNSVMNLQQMYKHHENQMYAACHIMNVEEATKFFKQIAEL